MLFEADLDISVGSNVQSRGNSNVLTISSAPSKRHSASPRKENADNNPVSNPFSEVEDEVDEHFEFEVEHFLVSENQGEHVQNAGIVHLSNELEHRLKSSDQVYCGFCMQVLKESKKVNDNMCITSEKGTPCQSTYILCKVTDMCIDSYVNTGPGFKEKVGAQ